MTSYISLISTRYKARINYLIFICILSLLVLSLKFVTNIYLNHIKLSIGIVSEEINFLNHIKTELEKIRLVIDDYKSAVSIYDNQSQATLMLYKSFDHITEITKPLKAELGQMKVEGKVHMLSTRLLGKLKNLESCLLLLTYIENLSYPFINVNGLELKFSGDGIDLAMQADLITYSLNEGNAREVK